MSASKSNSSSTSTYEGVYKLLEVYEKESGKNLSVSSKGRCLVRLPNTSDNNNDDVETCYKLRLEKTGYDGNSLPHGEYRWSTKICNRMGGLLSVTSSEPSSSHNFVDTLTVKEWQMTQVLSMFPDVMRLESCFGRIIMGRGQGGRVASSSPVGIRLLDEKSSGDRKFRGIDPVREDGRRVVRNRVTSYQDGCSHGY